MIRSSGHFNAWVSLRRFFALVAEEAELPDDFVTHDLRHRRVTSWLAEGKSPALVKEAMELGSPDDDELHASGADIPCGLWGRRTQIESV